MGRLGAIVYFLLQAMTGFANGIVDDYPLKQVGCHSYVIYGAIGHPTPDNQGFIANSGLVVSEKGVVVIDPGSSLQAGRMVLRRLREITGRPVTHVINTHAHGEHWLGNQAVLEVFPEVRILAHHRMLAELSWMQANDWIAYMEKMTDGFTRGTRAMPPRESVRGVTALYFGDVTLRIRALDAGQEATSVVVEVVEDSVAFVGEELHVEPLDPAAGDSDLPHPILCNVRIPVKTAHYVPDHGPVGLVGMVECPDAVVAAGGWKM